MTGFRVKLRLKPAREIDIARAVPVYLAGIACYVTLPTLATLAEIELAAHRAVEFFQAVSIVPSDLSEDIITDFAAIAHAGLRRPYPALDFDDFLDLSVSLDELVAAASTVIQVAWGQT